MACERWRCTERGEYRKTAAGTYYSSSLTRRFHLSPILGVILLLSCCTLSLALVQSDHDYYSYSDVASEARSSLEYDPSYVSFIPHDELLVRERRMANEQETINSERQPQADHINDNRQQPQQQQQQPPQLQQEQHQQPTQQTQQQQQQQQQPQQQQQQGQPKQEDTQEKPLVAPPAIQQPPQQQPQPTSQQEDQHHQQQQENPANTTTITEDVSYSTISGSATETHESPVTTTSSVDSSTAKQDNKKKVIVVSFPKNPASGSTTRQRTSNVTEERTPGSYVTKLANNPNKKSEVTSLTTVKDPGNDKEQSDTDIGDISISKFSDMNSLNKSLTQNNITKTEMDTHQYYNSTFIINESIAKKYWVDMDNHPEVRVNHLLSSSHRRAATVKLKFDFPFYGHKVRNITIATGGFLYTGEYVHSWLAATQYIAPLMANFDTRLSNESFVKYADNGTSFTVEWEKVVLQEKWNDGAFTFQVTLHQNGDIVFVYSEIPFILEQIEDTTHPVKVGLSDAYIMDRTIFFVRRKTIYEYHRVNFNRQDIKNWTMIYLRALPTCLEMDNCRDCLTKLTGFDCKWCSELNQCSTGTFRSRQDWLLKGCDIRNIKEVDKCPPSMTTYKTHEEEYNHDGQIHTNEDAYLSESSVRKIGPGSNALEHQRDNMNMSVSGVIGILLVVTLIAGLGGWVAYAYRNPHSASGQMLIRYRPSQWSWRRGEARYTAATIHM